MEGGGYILYTKKHKKINYVSQPKIHYYVKNIHSIRLKPSKISTLAHPKMQFYYIPESPIKFLLLEKIAEK